MNDEELAKRVAALLKAGASEQEIDSFLAEWDGEDFSDVSGGMTSSARIPGKVPLSVRDHVLRPALQGATQGFSDELRGAFSLPMGEGRDEELARRDRPGSITDLYKQERNRERTALAQAREDHPVVSGISELVGGVAAPGASYLKLAKGAPLAIRAAAGMGSGAISGAIYGAGQSEGGSLQEVAKDVGQTGWFGTAIGGVLPPAVAGGRAIVNAVRKNIPAIGGAATGAILAPEGRRLEGATLGYVGGRWAPRMVSRFLEHTLKDASSRPGPLANAVRNLTTKGATQVDEMAAMGPSAADDIERMLGPKSPLDDVVPGQRAIDPAVSGGGFSPTRAPRPSYQPGPRDIAGVTRRGDEVLEASLVPTAQARPEPGRLGQTPVDPTLDLPIVRGGFGEEELARVPAPRARPEPPPSGPIAQAVQARSSQKQMARTMSGLGGVSRVPADDLVEQQAQKILATLSKLPPNTDPEAVQSLIRMNPDAVQRRVAQLLQGAP